MGIDLVVVGLGYVGLPLARAACAAGLSVTGVDVSKEVVAGLRAGRSHVGDIGDADVAAMLAAGFTATVNPAPVGAADTVVICVPTGLADGEPDLSSVLAAAEAVARHLRPGTLVVLESTSYPGTTEEVLAPVLESGGLVAGADFHLAFSPERIDPANAEFGFENTPKVVGGLTPVCAKRCAAFYEDLVETVVVAAGVREAETAKLLENSYRLVNIALVDELAVFCAGMGVDVWDVLRCASTKPFGFQPFTPGPGVGGHCIPVDPRYLASRARASGLPATMITTALEVTSGMPGYVARRASELLARDGQVHGSRALLVGVSYKADVADVRQSPAVGVVRHLRALGARVSYHDPHVPEFTVDGVPVPRGSGPVEVAVVLQDHAATDLPSVLDRARTVLDTRGVAAGDHVERL